MIDLKDWLNEVIDGRNLDADYTTNAGSYYDDLARRNKLMQILIEKIYNYDKELAIRFEAWDKNLEEFDQEVLNLLQQWLVDGTLQQVIDDLLLTKTYSFINSRAYPSLQAAIDAAIANGKILHVEAKTHVLTQALTINGTLTMIGNPRSTILDFSTMTTSPSIIIGNGDAVNGFEMNGFTIKGNALLTCFKLNGTGTISTPVTDSTLRNLRVENFGIGLIGTYNWCNLVENVRFQNCNKPLQLGSQFNNSEFLRCSMVTFDQSMSFTNCEGIHFTSPNIANFTGTHALDIFQSFISMTNPYFEFISNSLAAVGRTSEIINSVLTIDTPKVTDASERVILNGNNAAIHIRNPDKPFYVEQEGNRIAAGKFSAKIKVDSPTPTLPQRMMNYYGQSPYTFISTNATAYTIGAVKNTDDSTNLDITVTAGGEAFAGVKLAENLVIGERYTLTYAIQSSAAVAFKNLDSADILYSSIGGGFTQYVFPFTAKATRADLIWNSASPINVMNISITKGQYFA